MQNLNTISVLSLCLLLFCLDCLQAQQVRALAEDTADLPDAPSATAEATKTREHLNLCTENSPFNFSEYQGTVASWMRSFVGATTLSGLPSRGSHPSGKDRDSASLQGREPYFMGSNRVARLTFYPVGGPAQQSTQNSNKEWEHWAHHVAWVEPIAMRVAQKGKIHPHVTTMLKLVRPQF